MLTESRTLKNEYRIEFDDAPIFKVLLYRADKYIGCFTDFEAVKEFLRSR